MSQATPFVVIVLQVTLIGAAAWLLNRSLSCRSAQTRHAIWITALIAMATTLPSKWIIPPLEIPTGSMAWNSVALEQRTSNLNIGELSTTALMDSSTGADRGHATEEFLPKSLMLDEGFTQFDGHEYDPSTTVTNSDALPESALVSTTAHRWTLQDGLILLYSLGFVFMVLRMAVSAVRLRWMYRQGFDLPKQLYFRADRASRTLALVRPPRIRICQTVQASLAFGIFRPTVLLPESFCNWSDACQQSVLTHELAHVARRDSIWDLLSQLTSTLYWFHPVVHCVARAQKRERELATDECVVAAGVDCIQYANHLLDVLSETGSQKTPRLAVAMSHFGDTQTRLAMVLRMSQHRPKRSRVAWLAGVIIFSTAGLSSFQLVAQSPETLSQLSPVESEPQKQDSGTPTIVEKTTNQQTVVTSTPATTEPEAVAVAPIRPKNQSNFFDRISSAKLVQDRDPGHTYSISGVVMGEDQKPAVGAVVAIRALRASAITSDLTRHDAEMIARTETNESGRYQFVDIPAVTNPRMFVRNWQVVAALPGGDFGWKSIDFDRSTETISPQANISLRSSTSIKGVYVDPNGVPIANATVILSALSDRDRGHYSDESIYLFRSPIGLQTKSDENGQFEFNGVPQGWVALVRLFHDDWAMKYCSIRTSNSIKTGRSHPSRPGYFLNPDIKASGSTIVAAKGYLIKGVVRTTDGAPVENCTISSAWQVGASTNENGEFNYRMLPEEFDSTGKPRDVMLRIIPGDISRGLLLKSLPITESEAKSGDALSIELQQGIPLVGKVLSEQGLPIGAINVMALPNGTRHYDHRSSFHQSSSTASDGSFRMIVPEGSYDLYAWGSKSPYALADGRARAIDQGPANTITASLNEFISSGEPLQVPDIKIPEANPVPIRVMDEDGRPVVGAELTLIHRPPPFEKMLPQQVNAAPKGVSDANGSFTFRPPVVYASNLVARASLETDSEHLWGEVTLPADPMGKDNVLIMKPMWRISGKVTVDGMPMQGVRVMVWRDSPGVMHAGGHSMNGDGKRVDVDGHYEWFVPPGGSYHVMMWDSPFNGNSQGHYSVVKTGENEFQAEEIKFTFAEGKISGRVTLADGTPVSGIRVNSFPKFKDANRMLLANPSPNTRRSVTRKDGTFTIEGLPDGQYQLSASSVTTPKTHYTATTHANAGDRDVHIIVTPVAKNTGDRI